jgi:hypothetical protein
MRQYATMSRSMHTAPVSAFIAAIGEKSKETMGWLAGNEAMYSMLELTGRFRTDPERFYDLPVFHSELVQ